MKAFGPPRKDETKQSDRTRHGSEPGKPPIRWNELIFPATRLPTRWFGSSDRIDWIYTIGGFKAFADI
jgi:hypothetical protein